MIERTRRDPSTQAVEGHRHTLTTVGLLGKHTPPSSVPSALTFSRHLHRPLKAFQRRTLIDTSGTLGQ